MAEKRIETHPVQRTTSNLRGRVPKVVTMKAYEVYCHVYTPQEDLVTGECRGGFGVNELIAFLYASSFPKEQWRTKVDEALRGMEHV